MDAISKDPPISPHVVIAYRNVTSVVRLTAIGQLPFRTNGISPAAWDHGVAMAESIHHLELQANSR